MKRRRFLQSAGAAGAGFTIIPAHVLRGKDTPSKKLNIALIGTWGRAHAHFRGLQKENVVALCDVDETHIASAAKKFTKAKHYVDWRKCLEQKDLDAVVCCTTDHTHAFIATWALNRDLHVYCEKPLANSVEEARVVRKKYMEKRDKLATQNGTQRHARPNFNRVRELVKDGAIGELKDVFTWGNRQLRRDGYLPKKGEPPKTLHYDLWIGPSPYHPYNPGYFSRGPGANCLSWNMFWDFGTGQVGDMGSHTMDLAWNAIDAALPTAAEAEGEKYNPEVSPVKLRMTFHHPANDWRGPIRVSWYQGGAMPNTPRKYVDINKIGHGALFKGSQGFVVADFGSRILIPHGDHADLSYYNKRKKDDMIPDLGNFQQEWLDACKGDLKTSCDFKYSGDLTEQMMLGLVAYRAGKKLKYDGKKGETDYPEANKLLSREYREGWVLDG